MTVTIYKRSKKPRTPYYVRIRDGNRTIKHISTRETSRAKAQAWVAERFASLLQDAKRKETPTLREFTHDFFGWDSSWSMDRRTSGRRHSKRHCAERERILEKIIIPELGLVRLDLLTTPMIKKFRDALFSRYSGSRTHQVLVTLRMILQAAEESELIDRLPRVPAVSVAPHKRTGVLTVEEAGRLFREGDWPDPRARVAALMAASTGMRIGELQGLAIKDLDLANGIVFVRRSWSAFDRARKNTTKSGYERKAVLPALVVQELETLLSIHEGADEPEAFVFFVPGRTDIPAEYHLWEGFYAALESIGIDRQERNARHLRFHGLRAFANSFYLTHGVPLFKVQELVGHRSLGMSQHCFRGDLDGLDDLREAASILTERLIG